jgi:hypothetical protein
MEARKSINSLRRKQEVVARDCGAKILLILNPLTLLTCRVNVLGVNSHGWKMERQFSSNRKAITKLLTVLLRTFGMES